MFNNTKHVIKQCNLIFKHLPTFSKSETAAEIDGYQQYTILMDGILNKALRIENLLISLSFTGNNLFYEKNYLPGFRNVVGGEEAGEESKSGRFFYGKPASN